MGIELMPPSVNRSSYRFAVHNDVVIYGLGAVRGIGEGPVLAMEAARTAAGPFKSLADFCHRVDSRKANKRVLDALIRSGAMDDFPHNSSEEKESLDCVRARLLLELNDAVQGAEQEARDSAFRHVGHVRRSNSSFSAKRTPIRSCSANETGALARGERNTWAIPDGSSHRRIPGGNPSFLSKQDCSTTFRETQPACRRIGCIRPYYA